ncbi:MAG: hypothetical protein HZA17_03600 [Nitrospirae bacterium]|nr:hypothetical protein [Nitrospirota bacterium]
MRISNAYNYHFFERTPEGREYHLTASNGYDLVLYKIVSIPDGMKKLQKQNIIELELASKYEGKGNFVIAGFSDDFHLWYMWGVKFLNLREKRYLLLEQETEHIPKRQVVVRRVPF